MYSRAVSSSGSTLPSILLLIPGIIKRDPRREQTGQFFLALFRGSRVLVALNPYSQVGEGWWSYRPGRRKSPVGIPFFSIFIQRVYIDLFTIGRCTRSICSMKIQLSSPRILFPFPFAVFPPLPFQYPLRGIVHREIPVLFPIAEDGEIDKVFIHRHGRVKIPKDRDRLYSPFNSSWRCSRRLAGLTLSGLFSICKKREQSSLSNL